MATTQQKAAPKKKSEGFTGVRGAFWVIVVCAIVAFTLFFTWFGNDMHFQDGAARENPADVWGTIFKGGVVVPVIHTLLLSVLAMSIERWMALKTAFGKGSLPKFVANIKAALKKAQKVAKIQQAHEEATQLEMPVLTMNLPILATMVTLGTLTGLLGTVTGMIKSFSALSAGGGADSAALSAGISEALINTAFYRSDIRSKPHRRGLIFANPLNIYHYG